MYNALKKIMFQFQPETIHNIVETALHVSGNLAPALFSPVAKCNFVTHKRLEQELFGVTFPNPIGIGAGFDKNATMIKGLTAMGFGCVEYGTVTPKPQPGNPKPRLFRFPEQESIQNAMGFNNEGMIKVSENVKKLYPYATPLGANIGKNKTTSQEEAIEDYRLLIDRFKDICDYLVINISSPNTPGLRDLQNEAFIGELFDMGCELTNKPILLKIAPDMEASDAIAICQKALDHGAKGIVATNTTIDYSLLENAKDFGGLSGKVLKEKSFKLFEEIAKEFYGKTTLISVGGIDSPEEAYRRIKAGASLIQIYSAFIFQGPNLNKRINEGILQLMSQDGFHHITEAIGADRR